MFEELIDSKTTKYVFLGLFALGFCLVIYFVWFNGEKKLDIAKYSTYSQQNANNKLASTYVNEVLSYFTLSQKEYVSDIIDEEYLKQNNLTKEKAIEMLTQKNMFSSSTETRDLKLMVVGDYILYSFKLVNGAFEQQVCLVETSPYRLTMVLDKATIYEGEEYEKYSSGVVLKINSIKVQEQQLTYNVKLKNNMDNNVVIDLPPVTGANVIDVDNGTYTLISTNVATNSVTLNKDGEISVELTFSVPITYYFNLAQLTLPKVTINGVETTLIYSL